MVELFAYRKPSGKPLVCALFNDSRAVVLQTANMPGPRRSKEKPQHYLKEWREFRHLTQQQLADAVGTDKSVISLLENGGMGMTDKWARKLAEPLRTRAGILIDHDPNDLPTDILDIWTSIPDEAKPQAQSILETFKKQRA
jgi:transcriptional regulator with XRE-family HTH domain